MEGPKLRKRKCWKKPEQKQNKFQREEGAAGTRDTPKKKQLVIGVKQTQWVK